MIRLFADYHTHTIYSHGKGTILDNVVAARKKGLKEIGISDHGPRHFSFGIEKCDFKKMRQEIDIINRNTSGIKVLLCVEANLTSMDGDIDIEEDDRQYLDMVLMGYHRGVLPHSFNDAKGLYINNIGAKMFPWIYENVRNDNTMALIKAINKNKIDIITHPGAVIPIDTRKLAQAAALRGTALEINCSHGYLTVEYIKIVMEEGAAFVISSDAHRPSLVGNFESGIKKADLAGLTADRIINAEK